MIVDSISRDEMLDAVRIYCTLHGLPTDEARIEQRVSRFLANEPDDLIDLAIVAYQEDRMVAPPDIVIDCWGKSRYYVLRNTGEDGQFRHQVFEPWFENDCSLAGLLSDEILVHFWTDFERQREGLLPERGPASKSITEYLHRGLRLRLRASDGSEPIEVHHCDDGKLGELSEKISDEIRLINESAEIRYLPLVDALYEQDDVLKCKLLVALAGPAHTASDIAAHAESAFFAKRAHC